jgi:hypothetical protein
VTGVRIYCFSWFLNRLFHGFSIGFIVFHGFLIGIKNWR